jgi:hypothetical protein
VGRHWHAHLIFLGSNPTECQWGQKAFAGYLSSASEGSQYDSTLLLSSWPKDKPLNIGLDYGTADQFYKDGQLRPESFDKALEDIGRREEVLIGRREGYDHSYYFVRRRFPTSWSKQLLTTSVALSRQVSTFAHEHVAWHAKHLSARSLGEVHRRTSALDL